MAWVIAAMAAQPAALAFHLDWGAARSSGGTFTAFRQGQSKARPEQMLTKRRPIEARIRLWQIAAA
jgi:hypothetical protein